MNSKILNDFTETLNSFLDPENQLTEILKYACLPPGKLFRPNLVYCLAHDLNGFTTDHKLLATAIEVHHAYTLVHDDLPSMDNDDFRRGKESVHKKYGEWKAVLAGDALMALSFEILSKMDHSSTLAIVNKFTQISGRNGLIYGQYLDLSHQNQSFDQLCKLHSLKTGELIKFSLITSFNLSNSKNIEFTSIEKIGDSLGLLFQLIDDLTELSDDLDTHEESINAFINFDKDEVLQRVLSEHRAITSEIKAGNLNYLNKLFNSYLAKMLGSLKVEEINKKYGINTQEIMKLI